MSTDAPPVKVVGGVVLWALDLLIQLVLIWLGVQLLFSEDDETIVSILFWWCAFGSLYWLASVIAVGVNVRGRPTWHRSIATWLDESPVSRSVTTVTTFLASLVGVLAAFELLVLRDDPDWSGWVDPVAVWAMLLSWALFHWGYARIYERRYRRATEKPLVFPGTAEPRLVDFVYFAFSNGTSFAVSDVSVTSSRMRWTVVWHTTFSFFLNALIIVLAINTIIR